MCFTVNSTIKKKKKMKEIFEKFKQEKLNIKKCKTQTWYCFASLRSNSKGPGWQKPYHEMEKEKKNHHVNISLRKPKMGIVIE